MVDKSKAKIKKILIVDDDMFCTSLVKMMLEGLDQ